MSVIGYAVIVATRAKAKSRLMLIRLFGQLAFAVVAAWLTTLVVNTMRILLAMSIIRHHTLVDWLSLDGESLHRMAGLMIYFPALAIQLKLGAWSSAVFAYVVATVIVVFMLIAVPLLTGNALDDTEMFVRHCVWLLFFIGSIFLSWVGFSKRNPALQLIQALCGKSTVSEALSRSQRLPVA